MSTMDEDDCEKKVRCKRRRSIRNIRRRSGVGPLDLNAVDDEIVPSCDLTEHDQFGSAWVESEKTVKKKRRRSSMLLSVPIFPTMLENEIGEGEVRDIHPGNTDASTEEQPRSSPVTECPSIDSFRRQSGNAPATNCSEESLLYSPVHFEDTSHSLSRNMNDSYSKFNELSTGTEMTFVKDKSKHPVSSPDVNGIHIESASEIIPLTGTAQRLSWSPEYPVSPTMAMRLTCQNESYSDFPERFTDDTANASMLNPSLSFEQSSDKENMNDSVSTQSTAVTTNGESSPGFLSMCKTLAGKVVQAVKTSPSLLANAFHAQTKSPPTHDTTCTDVAMDMVPELNDSVCNPLEKNIVSNADDKLCPSAPDLMTNSSEDEQIKEIKAHVESDKDTGHGRQSVGKKREKSLFSNSFNAISEELQKDTKHLIDKSGIENAKGRHSINLKTVDTFTKSCQVVDNNKEQGSRGGSCKDHMMKRKGKFSVNIKKGSQMESECGNKELRHTNSNFNTTVCEGITSRMSDPVCEFDTLYFKERNQANDPVVGVNGPSCLHNCTSWIEVGSSEVVNTEKLVSVRGRTVCKQNQFVEEFEMNQENSSAHSCYEHAKTDAMENLASNISSVHNKQDFDAEKVFLDSTRESESSVQRSSLLLDYPSSFKESAFSGCQGENYMGGKSVEASPNSSVKGFADCDKRSLLLSLSAINKFTGVDVEDGTLKGGNANLVQSQNHNHSVGELPVDIGIYEKEVAHDFNSSHACKFQANSNASRGLNTGLFNSSNSDYTSKKSERTMKCQKNKVTSSTAGKGQSPETVKEDNAGEDSHVVDTFNVESPWKVNCNVQACKGIDTLPEESDHSDRDGNINFSVDGKQVQTLAIDEDDKNRKQKAGKTEKIVKKVRRRSSKFDDITQQLVSSDNSEHIPDNLSNVGGRQRRQSAEVASVKMALLVQNSSPEPYDTKYGLQSHVLKRRQTENDENMRSEPLQNTDVGNSTGFDDGNHVKQRGQRKNQRGRCKLSQLDLIPDMPQTDSCVGQDIAASINVTKRKRRKSADAATLKIQMAEAGIEYNSPEEQPAQISRSNKGRKRKQSEEDSDAWVHNYYQQNKTFVKPEEHKPWSTITESPHGETDMFGKKRLHRYTDFNKPSQMRLRKRQQKALKNGWDLKKRRKHQLGDDVVQNKLALLWAELDTCV